MPRTVALGPSATAVSASRCRSLTPARLRRSRSPTETCRLGSAWQVVRSPRSRPARDRTFVLAGALVRARDLTRRTLGHLLAPESLQAPPSMDTLRRELTAYNKGIIF